MTLATDFETLYPDLVRYLSHHAGQGEQARDLVHEIWLRLADAPARQARQPRAYLFGAARHLAIDRARRDHHYAELLADAALRQAHSAPDAAEHLALRQALDAVARALRALPERTRTAFLAHRIEGTGHDELALRHGVARSTIERDIQRAHGHVQEAIERWRGGRASNPGRRKSLAALLGMAGAAVTAALLLPRLRTHVAQWQRSATTPVGRVRRDALPDGSLLVLDADSAIEATCYDNRRDVRLLRGGAFFDVAHDAQRPFGVQAGAACVTALGTRFAVELEGASARPELRVAVESGRVRVQSRGGAAVELGAGESLRVGVDGDMVRASPSGDGVVAPWRDGWLSFSHTPLAEVAQRIARYRPGPLRVAPEVAALPVSGEVRIAQADEWLHLLPKLLPVRVRSQSDGALDVLQR